MHHYAVKEQAVVRAALGAARQAARQATKEAAALEHDRKDADDVLKTVQKGASVSELVEDRVLGLGLDNIIKLILRGM